MLSDRLASFGWGSLQERQWLTLVEQVPGLRPARVVDVHRSLVHVVAPDLDLSLPVPLKLENGPLAVGDWVAVNESGERITQLLERKSGFTRRAPGTDRVTQTIAANVDTLFIVSSCNQDFNEARLERYLALGRDAGSMCLIVLTKADICEDSSDYVRRASRLATGLVVEAVNALDNASLHCLEVWLGSGQTVALLGSSGVGKTTLTNTFLGAAASATQPVREDDDRGRHTTTARKMYQLPGGAWVMDTPGMRELQLTDVRAGIDDVFSEIETLAKKCRFADCTHVAEPGCAVLQAIENDAIDASRINRWRKLIREDARNSETIAERHARDKSTGKYYKSVIGENQRRKGRGTHK